MGAGWLTPNSIKQTDGSFKIKSDGDLLLPQWTFPNYSGEVILDTTPGGGGGSATIETADACLIASGAIAPALPTSMIGDIWITGEGNADDALTTITAGATFEGKILFLRTYGTTIITVTHGAGLILPGGLNFTLNSVDDVVAVVWKSANVWRALFATNCG